MKMKIEIKNPWRNEALFEHEKENNTIKDTLIEAVKNHTDLYGANLRNADLRGVKEVPYIPMNCPSDGTFIGWKKVNNHLIRLEIPEDAKRSSATTMKCRCDKAKVLKIVNLDTNKVIDEITNIAYYQNTIYKVGEMVYPDSFDEDRWNECSHGIHFFVNKEDAINY